MWDSSAGWKGVMECMWGQVSTEVREMRGRKKLMREDSASHFLVVYGLWSKQGYQEKFVHIFFEIAWESKGSCPLESARMGEGEEEESHSYCCMVGFDLVLRSQERMEPHYPEGAGCQQPWETPFLGREVI